MVIPFPYGDTLKMIMEIAKGMEYLHSLGDMDSFTIHHSTKVELKEDLAYDGFLVVIGD